MIHISIFSYGALVKAAIFGNFLQILNTFNKPNKVIDSPSSFMKLDQFLKWKGLVATGGEAKHLITLELVRVNGITETRRGRKLLSGDSVSIGNKEFIVSI